MKSTVAAWGFWICTISFFVTLFDSGTPPKYVVDDFRPFRDRGGFGYEERGHWERRKPPLIPRWVLVVSAVGAICFYRRWNNSATGQTESARLSGKANDCATIVELAKPPTNSDSKTTPLTAVCPGCRRRLVVPESQTSHWTRCPKCGAFFEPKRLDEDDRTAIEPPRKPTTEKVFAKDADPEEKPRVASIALVFFFVGGILLFATMFSPWVVQHVAQNSEKREGEIQKPKAVVAAKPIIASDIAEPASGNSNVADVRKTEPDLVSPQVESIDRALPADDGNPAPNNSADFGRAADKPVETVVYAPQWNDFSGCARGTVLVISHKNGHVYCAARFLRTYSQMQIERLPVFRRNPDGYKPPFFVGEIDSIVAERDIVTGRCDGFVPVQGDFVVMPNEAGR